MAEMMSKFDFENAQNDSDSQLYEIEGHRLQILNKLKFFDTQMINIYNQISEILG